MTDINHIELTAEIVAAYVAHNSVQASDLPGLLRSVYDAVGGLGKDPAPTEDARREPAVPIKKSVTPDYIISLEDGRKLKSMKCYLGKLGMTPADYRAKWGLPHDYPTVAPNYAARRSELAKKLGLGRRAAVREAAE